MGLGPVLLASKATTRPKPTWIVPFDIQEAEMSLPRDICVFTITPTSLNCLAELLALAFEYRVRSCLGNAG